MKDIYYSSDEETFNYESIDEAICDVFESENSFSVGDIITVYSGEPVKRAASYFVRDIHEDMNERAYDEAGEWGEDYPECNKEQRDELQKMVNAAVDEWADKHNLQPKFYGIKNQKEIKAKLLNLETGDYEILDS